MLNALVIFLDMKKMGKFLPKSQEFGMVHLQEVI
jgi:hypothetical protein